MARFFWVAGAVDYFGRGVLVEKFGFINRTSSPTQERKDGLYKTKPPTYPNLIENRAFPVHWRMPTRKFDPRCLTTFTDLMPPEKQRDAMQTGYVAWHRIIAGVGIRPLENGFEMPSEANQSLGFNTYLTRFERQSILFLVCDVTS